MFKNIRKDSRGVAPVVLIIVAAVVLAGIGFVAYRVATKDKSSDSLLSTAEQKAAAAECEKKNDKDLCKFMTSWKANQKYRMTITDQDGQKSTFEIDGNKSRMSMPMNGAPYEVITIDKTTYTKAGETWYKQTHNDQSDQFAEDFKVDFDEPSDSEEVEDTTTYKNLGKEACGDLQCFKYQVITDDSEETEFIWFDDNDYQLRRVRSESKDGATEMTFEYDNVSISEPSPVKELQPNQHIMPGQSEPMTMPDMSQFGQ